MSPAGEAARIARETTLGPIEVQHYLHGGLDGEIIKAFHGLAREHNITMGQVVEKFLPYLLAAVSALAAGRFLRSSLLRVLP